MEQIKSQNQLSSSPDTPEVKYKAINPNRIKHVIEKADTSLEQSKTEMLIDQSEQGGLESFNTTSSMKNESSYPFDPKIDGSDESKADLFRKLYSILQTKLL